MRLELLHSDPFLTYASCNWYKHVGSVDEAKALEPYLDMIIEPAKNNLYLWTGQSGKPLGSGVSVSRHFFHSRAEIAIEYNIQWLAAYLLESTSAEPEDIFPARDLPTITWKAPSILQYLLDRKPEYYRPAINRAVFMKAVRLQDGSLETLQLLLGDNSNWHLLAALLKEAAGKRNGDKIFKYLFSKKEKPPITAGMLNAAASNGLEGSVLLRQFFAIDPSIRVDTSLVSAAMYGQGTNNLRVLFEHDPDAPVTAEILERVIYLEKDTEKLKFLLEMKPDIPIQPNMVELAVDHHREDTVKLLFDTHEDLKVTETILKKAVSCHGRDLAMTEYLLNRCNPELINQDLLLTAACGMSSKKTVALLLKHNDKLLITDDMLIASARRWNGELLDELLELRGGQEVPKNWSMTPRV